ncbi:MAG TPA: hypothetical protein VGL74_03295 [Terriglobales bacterium]|jgi:hypothetical protein
MSNLRDEHLYNILPVMRGKDAGKLAFMHHAVTMTAAVLMRTGIGIDHLSYPGIVSSALLMVAASWFGNLSWLPLGLGRTGEQDNSLLCFALFYFVLALYQRRKRESEIKGGALPEEYHTESVGNGRFGFLPFERRFLGFVDPFLVLLASALVVFRLHVATLLGLWGLLAGAAFLATEAQVYSHCEAMFRGGLNANSLARMRGKVLSHIEQAQAVGSQGQEAITGTIATDMDDLLISEIARRGQTNSQENTGAI